MPAQGLQTDYLIVGAGAMGMAFADELLARDGAARIIMIDKHARAGGHWNDAYPYVTLHQPAAFYGVNSESLGPGGPALVSGTEVLAYYERVMEKLKSSGRLRFFPLSAWDGKRSFRSLADGEREYEVEVSRRLVNATYMNVEVPSIRPPRFAIDEGASVVPPNALHTLSAPPSGYVIVGAGKTGMDAVLFLLARGVDPDRIQWIMPNDAWLLDRAQLVPGALARQALAPFKAMAHADSLESLLRISEAAGGLLRLDPEIWPRKYRCATVSREELQSLRRIEKVIRMGRVQRIGAHEIVLEEGSIETEPDRLHVDCTADGLARRAARPLFGDGEITLQSLVMCQQVFSASVVGYIETNFASDSEKNALCDPVPHPNEARDFLMATLVTNANMQKWLRKFPRWLRKSRLSMLHHDSLFAYLKAGYQAQRLMAKSTANFEKIFEEEFPDLPFPAA